MNITSNILETITKWSVKWPSKSAIIDSDKNISISYIELQISIEILSSILYGQTILLSLPNGIENAVIWLAALNTKSYLIPISPNSTDEEIEKVVGDHKLSLIISEDVIKKYKKIKRLNSKDILSIKKNTVSKTKEGSAKVYLTTSGSTGIPKGIELDSEKLIYTANGIIKVHELTKNDICFTPLPFYHVNAPVVGLLSTILSGGTLVICHKFSRSKFWHEIILHKPTWISIVPAIVAILLVGDDEKRNDLSFVRFVRSASAPLPVANLKRFEDKFNIPLIETYGLTEAGSTIASNPLPPRKHKMGSVGNSVGVEIRIAKPYDESDELIKFIKEDIGEICIKGPNVIEEYYGGSKNHSFFDGWFRTGDLGYIDNDGYVYITGRIRDIIIRGGENISPREIEEAIYELPFVDECCVVGHPDKIYGEKVVVFITLKNKLQKDIKNKIHNHLKEILSSYKLPSQIYILDKLPRGKTNKIDKNALREYQ